MKSTKGTVEALGDGYLEVRDHNTNELHFISALQIVTTLRWILRVGQVVLLEYFGEPGAGDWNVIEIVEY